MPWIALICLGLVGGCFFDADYSSGTYTCSDGICPSGLVCVEERCVAERKDAAVDTPTTDVIDARMAALICGDPGVLPIAGGTVMGTTANRQNTLQPLCNGSMMFGFDAVYRIDAGAGAQLTLQVAAQHQASAYVVQPCASNNGCVGNTYALPNAPVSVTVLSGGPPFVIVDSPFAATNGDYTLTVTVN